MDEGRGEPTEQRAPLTPTQVYLLAGLFAALALGALGRWWFLCAGRPDPALAEAPKNLDYPADAFRVGPAAKSP